MKNQFGYLLMNLLVSCGIIVLLATISIPYIKKYQPNLKLNSAARILISDLRYAQQLTVTEQVAHGVKLDLISDSYSVLKLAEAATSTIKTVIFDQDLSFSQITGLIDDIVVFNYYGAVSQPGQIVLININNVTATINIKPSGYIQLE